MSFKSRIEQLKNDGSEVAQQIKSLQNKIDELNNKREEAVIKSDHDKFLKLTKEYKELDSELQDRQALDLAITRTIRKMETEEKIQIKKKIYDDAQKWAEQVRQEKRECPKCYSKSHVVFREFERPNMNLPINCVIFTCEKMDCSIVFRSERKEIEPIPVV